MTELSVVVAVKDDLSGLRILVDSFLRQDCHSAEMIIVDSSGKSGQGRELAPNIRVLRRRANRSEARNMGAKVATSGLLLFLDSDMELSPGMLASAIALARDYDAVCVKEDTSAGSNFWAKSRALERNGYFRSSGFEGARLIRRSVFEAVGGFDVGLVGNEDVDLHLRVLTVGGRIGWLETPLIHHEEHVGLVSYIRKRYQYSLSDKQFSQRWGLTGLDRVNLRRRVRTLLTYWRTRKLADLLLLLPGLVFIRTCEIVVRMIGQRRG